MLKINNRAESQKGIVNDLKVNDQIIIKDIDKSLVNGTSINSSMIKFSGKEATIVQIFVNMYDKNDYYFLDIDEEKNIWKRDLLK